MKQNSISIVVSGTCGSGKTTVTAIISKCLKEYGFEVLDMSLDNEYHCVSDELIKHVAEKVSISMLEVQQMRSGGKSV